MKAAVVFVVIGSMAVGPSFAAEPSGADVVKAKGCMNCHDVDKKKVGPSFKDIAAKHKDSKDAPALVARLKEGKGHTKINASDAELTSAVQYVLSAQ